MYTCHVSCVRRSILEDIGPLRSEYDGAQDWDFILRVTERTRRIAHIPKVLYHWRIIPQSVSASIEAKPYAIDASVRLRKAALVRRGLVGDLERVDGPIGYHRVRYGVQGSPTISVVIPSRDNGAVLLRCLSSIDERSSWKAYEVIVVDHSSSEPQTLDILAQIAESNMARVVRHEGPFNFSRLSNLGAYTAQGSILLFLNDDTELLSADALERMAGYDSFPISAVGAKLLYPNTPTVQHVGIVNTAQGPCHAFYHFAAHVPGYFMRNLLEYNWLAVTGAVLMIERQKFDEVGCFDEMFPVAYNDMDFCIRLVKRGLHNVVCPSAEWLHHESLSRGHDYATPTSRARLQADLERLNASHPEFFMEDPYYSPNLRQDNAQFEIPA